MNTEGYQPMSGRMLDSVGRVYNIVDMFSGAAPISDKRYDIDQYSPRNGNIINKHGEVKNIVTLLGGGTPITGRVFDVSRFADWYGGVLGEDGLVYDIVDLLSNYSGSGGGLFFRVIDGELYATYNEDEGELPVSFELDSETGMLYCVFGEG